MRAAAISLSLFAGLRRGLVLLAALSFVISGVSSIHTAHAMAGGHDTHLGKPALHMDSATHCESHDQSAPEAKKEGTFSCCAFACAPAIALPAVPQMFGVSPAGSSYVAYPQRPVLLAQIAGLFRPPRNLD